jgi:hypothetical protein
MYILYAPPALCAAQSVDRDRSDSAWSYMGLQKEEGEAKQRWRRRWRGKKVHNADRGFSSNRQGGEDRICSTAERSQLG